MADRALVNRASDDAAPLRDAGTYEYLEQRPHRWRKQLFLKGRNMAVVHVVYGMRANGLSPEDAAREYDLPLAQIEEALRYYESHRDLIEEEQREERRQLEAAGVAIDPPSTR